LVESRLIAGFVGPLLLSIGIAVLVNRDLFPEMAVEVSRNTGLIFLSGILSLLAGIAIVRVHNIWSAGWPLIVTVLGWLAVIGGVLRMWAPQLAAPFADALTRNPTNLLIAGALFAALGAFLSFKAYWPSP
jgi:hypothetical protein